MSDLIIVSCSYSETGRKDYYGKYADRLTESLDKFAPGVERHIWRDSWPPQSPPHGARHYAFKWFAINHARASHRYVIWMDSGCVAVGPTQGMIDRLKRDGYLLLEGNDILGEWISDEALGILDTDRETAMGMKLFGGCVLGFDFESKKANDFFTWYERLAKHDNLFMCAHNGEAKVNGIMRSVLVSDGNNSVTSTDKRVKGHRSDEACFSIMSQRLDMKPMSLDEWYTYFRTY